MKTWQSALMGPERAGHKSMTGETWAEATIVSAWPERLVIGVLAGYKRFVSPRLPSSCRFYPSCSDYAREAVERHGLLRGISLAAWRLLRCQPLSQGGLDPVPGGPEHRARLE